jgi:hypothetical protein
MSPHVSIVNWIALLSLAGCVATLPPPETVESEGPRASVRSPRTVYGDLDIANHDSLEAFADLEVVTGTLTIVGNTRLGNLDGLEQLRVVRALVITENLALRDIEALAGLEHAKSVTITKNPRLESLSGLDSLRRLDRLVVEEDGIFTTRGLGGLVEVGELSVSKNWRLLNLRGLAGLESADNVTIVGNPRLAAHGALFPSLGSVRGKLDVRRNTGLAPSDVCALVKRVQAHALASR